MKIHLFLITLIALIPVSVAVPQMEKTSNIEDMNSNYITVNYITVREYIEQQYEQSKAKKINVVHYKLVLPLSIKLIIKDNNETIFLKIGKNGLLILPESMRKVDLEIKTSEATFFEIIENENNLKDEDLKKYIENGKIEVIANSLKAQVAIQVFEDKFGIIIEKKKTFRAKTIAFLSAKFVGLFLKKNA